MVRIEKVVKIVEFKLLSSLTNDNETNTSCFVKHGIFLIASMVLFITYAFNTTNIIDG